MATKVKRVNSNILRNEKDMAKKEQVLDQKIDNNNKTITDAFLLLQKQIQDTLNN